MQYAREKLNYKFVVAVGTSTGAVAAILVAAEDEFQQIRKNCRIDALVCENPFASRNSLLRGILSAALGPVPKVIQFLKDWYQNAVMFLGMRSLHLPDYARTDAVDVIQMVAPRPVLFMHGTHDSVVSVDHSYQLYQAAKEPRDLWVAKDATHTALHNLYPEEWETK